MATKIIDLGLAGPDDPIYKSGLIMSSVLGPGELTKNSRKNTDGESPSSAQAGPNDPNDPEPAMKGAREALERAGMELASRDR